ncbi:MAG: glycosyltransferase family 4 protein [Capsulimonadaceae bacterium]
MRICIINEYFHPDETGGTGTVLSEMCRALKDRYENVDLDILTSRNQYRDDAKLAPFEDWNGIRIHRLTSPKPNGLPTPLRLVVNMHFGLCALLALLRAPRYDAVIVATAPPVAPMAARWYRAITGTPFLYIVYDLEPDRAVVMNVLKSTHPVARMFRAAQSRWLLAANQVIVLGRCMRDYLVKTYHIPADNIEIIATGADPNSIVPSSRDSRFRRRHGITGFTVLYSGNFGRYHDFDTMLDAAASLRQTHPDITILLIGDGIQKEHIEKRCEVEHLSNVRLFPFVPKEEYADLLATADVALVTLEAGMEGICVPSKIYGILAAGRPVIAVMSPACEVAHIIDENNCGRQLPVGDWRRLADAISEMATRPTELAQMGRNARMALVRKYTTEVIADRFYQTLLQLTGGHAMPRPPADEVRQADSPRPTDSTAIRSEAADEVTT